MTIRQPSYMFSAWKNYKEWESTCPDCNWTGLLAQANGSKQASEHLRRFTCQQCHKSEGLREAIYGMPEFAPDETKFFVAGCTAEGQGVVCILCRWGIEDEND